MWHTAAAVTKRPRSVEGEAETAVHALQGGEGGGHTGEIPTSMLIPAVGRDSISCILFADSTIHDPRNKRQNHGNAYRSGQ